MISLKVNGMGAAIDVEEKVQLIIDHDLKCSGGREDGNNCTWERRYYDMIFLRTDWIILL
jgi:hypothetical protein